MSFLQQVLSPFIGRRSKKNKTCSREEIPQTYPYYPDPVIRYRRENSPFTATFPQEPISDDGVTRMSRASVRGWQTPNGFVPSRPISPTLSNQSSCPSYWANASNSSAMNTPVPPPIPSPPPTTFLTEFRESPTQRSPTPPFPQLTSHCTTPCATPAPSVAPLSRIPQRDTVSPSPERYTSPSERDRRRTSRPPPSPSPSTRSIGVQTPIMGRRINLPGGATPVLGRRGLIGIVISDENQRDSAYSQYSFQTCSEYRHRETTSLFRALSLTPRLRRKKRFTSSNLNSNLTGNSCSNMSSFSFASTGSELQTQCNSISSDIGSRTYRHVKIPVSDISSLRERSNGNNCEKSSLGDRFTPTSVASGDVGNNVVEVRVGEAGLVRRRRRTKTNSREDGLATSVRVSRHQETWHCLPLANLGDHSMATTGEADRRSTRASIIPEEVRLSTTVNLQKKDHVTLGIVVTGGSDKGYRPRIARLRPGSAAHRSDALLVGDYIHSVNGAPTGALTHQQVVGLLKAAGNAVDIGIEYEAPSLPGIGPEGVLVRRARVKLEKDGGNLGVTIRGGLCTSDADKSRPLVIAHVRTAGPVDREGTIKAGDRLVAVDDRSTADCTMTDAQEALRNSPDAVTLTIEYDVSVLESVRERGGALLVEVERPAACELGLLLAQGPHDTIVVSGVKTASIAERCGALAAGDTVNKIDGTSLLQLTPTEAMQLLRTSRNNMLTLEIMPVSSSAAAGYGLSFPHLLNNINNNKSSACSSLHPANASCTSPLLPTCSGPCYSSSGCRAGGYATACNTPASSYCSQRGLTSCADITDLYGKGNILLTSNGCQRSIPSRTSAEHGQDITELLTVTLRESDQEGYGLVLRPPSVSTDPGTAVPIVAAVEINSSADRCGVVCVGDRITAVNGRSTVGVGAAEVTHQIASSRPMATLTVEFNITDASVVTVPGSKTVKLKVKHLPLGVGISLAVPPVPLSPTSSASSTLATSPNGLIISSVGRGSPAHRSGVISPGDSLIAVNHWAVTELSDAQEVLNRIQDTDAGTVTLMVRKDDLYGESSSSPVQYTVEVSREGGPLGLTLSGSEDPLTVLYIAALNPGGLAERTGAVHVGDRLLAINGRSLRGHPLSYAVSLLQEAADTVTLRIARPRTHAQHTHVEECGGGAAASSVDSAVESWGDSSGGGEQGAITPPATPGPDAGDQQQTDLSAKEKVAASSTSSNKSCINSGSSSEAGSGVNQTQGGSLSATKHNNKASALCKGSLTIRLPSTSPPPTPDSRQSGGEVSKPDWDEMIAALNSISESCRLANGGGTAGQHDVGGPNGGGTDGRAGAGDVGEQGEEGVYNVPVAELTHDVTAAPGTEHEPQQPRLMYRVCLTKDPVYEDFGFSVSDGLYEKGVYVNRVRQGGPADRSGRVRPYDRILQVNDTLSHDFDCCLTVPLIASAGEQLRLLLSRSPDEGATTLLRLTPEAGATPMMRITPEATESAQQFSSRMLDTPHPMPGTTHGILSSQFIPPTQATHTPQIKGSYMNESYINSHPSNGVQKGNTSPITVSYSSVNTTQPTLLQLSSFPAPSSPSALTSTTHCGPPLQGKTKLHMQKLDFLNTQLYCNENPFVKNRNDIYNNNEGYNVNCNDNASIIPAYGTYINARPNCYDKGSCSPLTQNYSDSFNGNRNPSFNTSGIPLQTFNQKTAPAISSNNHPPKAASSLQEQLQSLGAVNRCHLLEWAEHSLAESNKSQPTHSNARPLSTKSPATSQIQTPFTPQLPRSYHKTNSSSGQYADRRRHQNGIVGANGAASNLHFGKEDVDVHAHDHDIISVINENILTTL